MKRSPLTDFYKKYYVDMAMERAGVFAVMRDSFGCETVLYPGCFIHVTPSFFFSHVVYVDLNEKAQELLADTAAVLDVVNSHKRYKRSAYVRFIAQDYTTPLPIVDNSFDLLIALYAGGIARACKRYLKIGGLLLTNDHHDDAGAALRDGELALTAVLLPQEDRYQVVDRDLHQYFVPKKPSPVKSHLSPVARYTRRAEYYVFQRIQSKT
ncbi:MAG: class I SAM-dependent methyltransferase [Anaerolineae bacterium]|nr:class I SAM-dependent methyltransferase [Anaerolineae bacterium]